MPATNFLDYAKAIGDLLDQMLAAGVVERVGLETDPRSAKRGLIVGAILFGDGSELHLREFVDLTLAEPRMMYAYHYQDANAALVLRYDNATHRPALSQPTHKHAPGGVTSSPAPTLAQVLDEILRRE